ncbi:AraC family transcriptional regulator [Aquabacterium sp.]|uniref:AraC family transcriptional regulator n=1 Tax=Aquabacterium sp. TaxID=1872578 RepID=UPI0025BC94D0|nr:AraC family transcriptional regulator [Aquabacterium sp.]
MDLADLASTKGVVLAELADPGSRVALDLVDELLQEALRAQDRAEGMPLSLQLGGAVTPVALDVLAYASMSSGTLGDAIKLLCQFEPYRLGFAQCELSEEGDDAVVTLQAQGSWPSLPLQIEAALAGWIEFGRWITGNVSHPRCIEFAHAADAPQARYEAFFHCPVLFERGRNAVHIDRQLLGHRLAASNPDVCRLMREEMQRRIERYARGEQFIVRMDRAIEACLSDGVLTLESVAQAMSLEPRQFRAQASAAGTSLTAAVDAVRQRLARQYLTGGVPLAEISQRLGYSEQSAFNRACVRWFGVSPGKWRADLA